MILQHRAVSAPFHLTTRKISPVVFCGSSASFSPVFRRYFFKSSSSSHQQWSSSSSSSSGFAYQPNGFSANTTDLSGAFRLNIAVSYQPKDREFREKGELYQQIAKSSQQKQTAHLSPTGEDNFVVQTNPQLNSVIVGVADGVGGWSELGYDSSAISRELCGNLGAVFGQRQSQDDVELHALLQESFDKVAKDGIVKVGGTTVCFGVISDEGVLRCLNLGDSWFGVFRQTAPAKSNQYSCVWQSKDQTHGFNTPYQLAVIPRKLQEESEEQGKRYLQDLPKDADAYAGFQLQSKDIVMFATDGVTDNVCPEDIATFISDEVASGTALESTAKQFVGKVNKLSQDVDYPSVFAQNLTKVIGQKYTGGKYDDITVVMVQVE